ncbi:hypothetical protein FN976_16905 [Caenimonas sedimenti]|uniref:AbiEi antitoxin C-terminal domain-containing protein n=1 Tax=Caenimonas sedimenti TaxID=2596921 RepID=A0A562ZN55_9BURK|nr:hypothetical protein [Caenimonas sedimenti]TWO70022.1 hypothetical protein FN976_16905 [Caenimonas sedimenti]
MDLTADPIKLARLKVSKAAMHRHFEASTQRTFGAVELAALIEEKAVAWRLPANASPRDVIEFLTQNSKLKRITLPRHSGNASISIFTWNTPSIYQLLQTSHPSSYFTHSTALHFHKLSSTSPAAIYLNTEQRPRQQDGELQQHRIDSAFRRHPRVTQSVGHVDDTRVHFVNGMHTGAAGVIEQEVSIAGVGASPLRFTNLSRTLIDIVVRPAYSGGAREVINAYKAARDQTSPKELADLLSQLNYIYPYHQSVGYCLEQAGHSQASLRALKRLPREFEFYLVHHRGDFKYIPEWRLHIPADLEI